MSPGRCVASLMDVWVSRFSSALNGSLDWARVDAYWDDVEEYHNRCGHLVPDNSDYGRKLKAVRSFLRDTVPL